MSLDRDETPGVSLRRSVIGSILSLPLSLLIPPGSSRIAAATTTAGNEEDAKKKPFAPLENLLPAIRVKRSIDTATNLTRSLVATENAEESGGVGGTDRETALARLGDLLLTTPQNYIQRDLPLPSGVPPKPADLYLKPYRSAPGDLPFQRALVRSGDVDAWKRLKRREKALERSSAVRAALNAYTDALSYSGESYLLTVDAQTRSRMVREDRLPDIKQVITSDMGMRYLYRNQILTAMDDVRAELEYQLNNNNRSGGGTDEGFDGRELLDLLVLAGDAMDRWLSLVPPADVEEAVRAVANE